MISDARETASVTGDRLKVVCYCDTDLVHSSYAVTGLIELADSGEIELDFKQRDRRVNRFRGVWTLWLKITGAAEERCVCIDTHDVATYHCPESLAACDFYYKSNLSSATFDAMPERYRNRLRPLGPYLPCRPLKDRALFRRWLGNAVAKFRHRFITATRRRSLWNKWRVFAPELNRHRRYASRKTWRDYESTPSRFQSWSQPSILFNPSCWDESEGVEIQRMNESRAQLIVALRETFGERFVGGFRNYGPSVGRYPEAIEPSPMSHEAYSKILQASPITVYVNGKWNCFSWRLLENFAAAKCMVSERIVNQADFALDESAGIIQCDSIRSIVERLQELSASPQQMQELSARSHRTYLERMRPAVRMRRLLAEAFHSATGAVTNESPILGSRN